MAYFFEAIERCYCLAIARIEMLWLSWYIWFVVFADYLFEWMGCVVTWRTRGVWLAGIIYGKQTFIYSRAYE